MSVADIFKIQTLYNQNNTFNDRADWQDAFNIANSFADTSEKHRANRENLATSDARVDYTNWRFGNQKQLNDMKLKELQRQYAYNLQTDPSAIQSAIAQNSYNATRFGEQEKGILGDAATQQILFNYGMNPDGTARTMPEVYQAAVADGAKFTPYSFAAYWKAINQEQANKDALFLAAVENARRVEYDAAGNPIKTNELIPQSLQQFLNPYVARGKLAQQEVDAFQRRLFPVAENKLVALGRNFELGNRLFNVSGFNLAPPANQNIVPYAPQFAPTTPAATTPTLTMPRAAADPTPPPVDYVSQYGLTEQDVALANQYAAAKGIAADEALKELATTVFRFRQDGTFTPEHTAAMLQKRIQRERELAKNRAALANPKVAQMQQQGLQLLADYGIDVSGYY